MIFTVRDRGVSVSSAYAGLSLLLREMEPSLIAKYIRGCIKNERVAYYSPPHNDLLQIHLGKIIRDSVLRFCFNFSERVVRPLKTFGYRA